MVCSAVPSAAKPITTIILRHPGDEAKWAKFQSPVMIVYELGYSKFYFYIVIGLLDPGPMGPEQTALKQLKAGPGKDPVVT